MNRRDLITAAPLAGLLAAGAAKAEKPNLPYPANSEGGFPVPCDYSEYTDAVVEFEKSLPEEWSAKYLRNAASMPYAMFPTHIYVRMPDEFADMPCLKKLQPLVDGFRRYDSYHTWVMETVANQLWNKWKPTGPGWHDADGPLEALPREHPEHKDKGGYSCKRTKFGLASRVVIPCRVVDVFELDCFHLAYMLASVKALSCELERLVAENIGRHPASAGHNTQYSNLGLCVEARRCMLEFSCWVDAAGKVA